MMHIHDLKGCAPTPLAHYLKALGILRLVAEQADPEARGWWHGDLFRLATKLDAQELETFFLERYEPTPIFNPWGGRSGFYPGSSETTARNVLNAIEESDDRRFSNYRNNLQTIRKVIKNIASDSKPSSETKDNLILTLRNNVRGCSLLWLESVAVVIGTGDSVSIKHPALFGTGGNEGSGSYTSAYMLALEQCILKNDWDHSLNYSLFGSRNAPKARWSQTMGQFLPEGQSSPWDLLLNFEGAIMIKSAVASRNTSENLKWMSSPFFMESASYGYTTGTRKDEYKVVNSKEIPGHGEQWFPIWNKPMLYTELSQIFIEGRSVTKRGKASDGWSMLRAITTKGVRQGIKEFVRYGYLQRNNLATHLAIPLGRYSVPNKIDIKLACLDDLDHFRWLASVKKVSRAKNSTNRLQLAEHVLGESLFAVAQRPEVPDLWQNVLRALSSVEAVMVTGNGFKAGPIPSLRPEWVAAADDGSVEFRLALAFALQADFEAKPVDGVRRHWLPMKGRGFAKSGAGSQARLDKKTDVAMVGRNGLDDSIALVRRRLIEAGQKGERRFPLTPASEASTHPADLALLLAGRVDLDRTLELARTLMAIDLYQWRRKPCPPARPVQHDYPDDAWLAIRLSLSPWPLADGRFIGADPAIFRRLESGDASTAFTLAQRRLQTAGIRTTVASTAVAPETARLWAAALAFPISKKTAERFARRLDPNAI